MTNVIAEQGLLERTAVIGGMNLPLALSTVLMKDTMETKEFGQTCTRFWHTRRLRRTWREI